MEKEIQYKMKILVTGSSGFIGQHLVPALESQGHNIVRADRTHGCDLTIKENVDNLPDVDIVVHLAAHNGTKHFYERPLDVIRDSVLPTQYLVDRYAGKIKRFVFTGTCESYAGAVDLFDWPVPTDETVPLVVSDVTNPRWSYGGSKIINELQITAAHSQLKQEYAIIRYHNVYGPGQVDHFIPEFYKRAKTGDLSLKGWENTRSFMYISDAIEATSQVIFESQCANQIVNIGVDDEKSIKDLATIILCEAGIVGELTLEPAPLGSVKRRCGDITKMTKLLNFVPKVSLTEGIRKTLESL
jgi:nucleoside-diphosphate-sugar epimerase